MPPMVLVHKESGKKKEYEPVDAREILRTSDAYEKHVPELVEKEGGGHSNGDFPQNVNIENETDQLGVTARRGGPNGDLDAMTVSELKARAEQNQIDLGDATRKNEIIAAIKKGRKLPSSTV